MHLGSSPAGSAALHISYDHLDANPFYLSCAWPSEGFWHWNDGREKQRRPPAPAPVKEADLRSPRNPAGQQPSRQAPNGTGAVVQAEGLRQQQQQRQDAASGARAMPVPARHAQQGRGQPHAVQPPSLDQSGERAGWSHYLEGFISVLRCFAVILSCCGFLHLPPACCSQAGTVCKRPEDAHCSLHRYPMHM